MIRTSRDLERYKKLYEQNAVSKQELDNRVAEAEQAQAAVDAQQACWKMPILIWEKLMSLRLLTDV